MVLHLRCLTVRCSCFSSQDSSQRPGLCHCIAGARHHYQSSAHDQSDAASIGGCASETSCVTPLHMCIGPWPFQPVCQCGSRTAPIPAKCCLSDLELAHTDCVKESSSSWLSACTQAHTRVPCGWPQHALHNLGWPPPADARMQPASQQAPCCCWWTQIQRQGCAKL